MHSSLGLRSALNALFEHFTNYDVLLFLQQTNVGENTVKSRG